MPPQLLTRLAFGASCAQALSALIQPIGQTLQGVLATLPQPTEPPTKLPKEIVDNVATLLNLVSASIRFCDRYKPERHPVLPVLQECWPLLMEVAMRCRGEPIVVMVGTGGAADDIAEVRCGSASAAHASPSPRQPA